MYYLIFSALFIINSFNDHGIPVQQDQVEGEWTIVTEESEINFKIQNLSVLSASGSFPEVEGTMELKSDLSGIQVLLTVDVASIDTGIDKRDKHLRSEEFFHVEEYPLITFTGNKITPQSTDTDFTVEGNLTIKNITREIVVPIYFHGFNDKGHIKFTGSKNINRRDYNIDYTGRGVGDVAQLEFTIVAKRK